MGGRWCNIYIILDENVYENKEIILFMYIKKIFNENDYE